MKFKGLLHRDQRVMQTNAHEYLFIFYKLLLWPFSATFSTLVHVQGIHISWFKSHRISVFTANRLSNIFSWGTEPDDSPCSAVSVRTANSGIQYQINRKLPFFSDHTSFSRGTCLVFSEQNCLLLAFCALLGLKKGVQVQPPITRALCYFTPDIHSSLYSP